MMQKKIYEQETINMCNMRNKKYFLLLRMFAFVAIIVYALTANAQRTSEICDNTDELIEYSVNIKTYISSPIEYGPIVSQESLCQKCKGRGTIEDHCPFCSGGGRPCKTCNKKGVVKCPKCRGNDKECSMCDENGEIPCTNKMCREGIEICRECSGTGYIEKTCPVCYGRGITVSR